MKKKTESIRIILKVSMSMPNLNQLTTIPKTVKNSRLSAGSTMIIRVKKDMMLQIMGLTLSIALSYIYPTIIS